MIRRLWKLDLLLFLIFEQQNTVKYRLKRNYRTSTFVHTNFLHQGNWLFWKKHTLLGDMYLSDVIGYENRINFIWLYDLLNWPGVFSIYNLFNNRFNRYINLICTYESTLSSIEGLWHSANYAERELMEFFGITISNKFDTRRLLLEYGMCTNPLLKGCGTFGDVEYYYSKYNDSLEVSTVTLFNL